MRYEFTVTGNRIKNEKWFSSSYSTYRTCNELAAKQGR